MASFEFHFLGVNKSFKHKVIISDARLKLKASQCTLLTGENGAGKSTLLKIMSGLEKPDSAVVRMNQQDYSWEASKSALLKNIMYLHQQPYMFDGCVRKNLMYLARVNRLVPGRIDEAIEWAGLQDIIEQNAKRLSGGEKQRVALARAYLRNPQVILLDEPTANLDQLSRSRTLKLLQQFKQSGTAMVIASHAPDFFNSIEDERLQLQDGRLTNLEPRYQAQKQPSAASVTQIRQLRSKTA